MKTLPTHLTFFVPIDENWKLAFNRSLNSPFIIDMRAFHPIHFDLLGKKDIAVPLGNTK